jgi:hypothetical protein
VNRAELVGAFRARVFDTAKPYLWSALEVEEYLEDAIAEACERAGLLRDTETPEIVTLTIAAEVATYKLDRRVLEVLRAKLDNQERPLTLTTMEGLDRDWPGWESEPANKPKCAVIDQQAGAWSLRLVPTPSEATVLRLHVCRLPLERLKDDKCAPEFHERLHIKLLDWMAYRAYSKADAETRDDDKAAAGAAAFAASFGAKRNARDALAQHDMQFPFVRPDGL